MPQRNHTRDRDDATESKFYLPVGVSPSYAGGRLKRIWAALFNHRI